MKKATLFVLTTILILGCSAAKIRKNNTQLEQLIAINDLKADVDYMHKNILQLHPDLYRYIDKAAFDYKFDSIKNTIHSPMNNVAFYKKISPLVASIRQGHSFIYAPAKQLDKKESKAMTKKGTGPFSQFDFASFNDKLYVIKNKSYNPAMKVGSEVVAVNGIKPIDVINEHNHYYSSDGYNTTFKTNTYSRRFSNYFTDDYGYKDSLKYDYKINDSIKTVTILRRNKDTAKTSVQKLVSKKIVVDKAQQKALKRRRKIAGFDKANNRYNRNLRFVEKDSSVAILKINSFSLGKYKKFYKETFTAINRHHTKTLIIDLRDNGGGDLSEIVNLYSYLSHDDFIFLDESEVVSKASLFRGAYFNEGSILKKSIKALFSPLVYGYLLFSVHKKDDGKNYIVNNSKIRKIDEKTFKGKLYVLINGGSFSASSIISSNLKGSKRATFVGEETGGAYNGTVAGFMPIVKLPNSKLKMRIGTLLIAPHYKTDIEGHGIYPDVAIKPTLQDVISGNDPELNWILKDLQNN
ncbi:S41 family peptidase [Flavobacterium muglaense]|uniref:Peptidase S41 n=1 Tax=Flavobacterium muglaense TaxID=2764716 RepID=A0A923MYZ2_9FLAO|nr:S41 family peptidase [Flavobacterium muglaense]MBC5837743.1 peptidase S41 [Flavobacterium muglaense]MBC5844269.1 peptidase S41 [Flavobacterium muglaense]